MLPGRVCCPTLPNGARYRFGASVCGEVGGGVRLTLRRPMSAWRIARRWSSSDEWM